MTNSGSEAHVTHLTDPELLRRTLQGDSAALVRPLGMLIEARNPVYKHSALQALERGRRLEVEETLGDAVRKGAKLEILLPTMDTCDRFIAGMNRSLQ